MLSMLVANVTMRRASPHLTMLSFFTCEQSADVFSEVHSFCEFMTATLLAPDAMAPVDPQCGRTRRGKVWRDGQGRAVAVEMVKN